MSCWEKTLRIQTHSHKAFYVANPVYLDIYNSSLSLNKLSMLVAKQQLSYCQSPQNCICSYWIHPKGGYQYCSHIDSVTISFIVYNPHIHIYMCVYIYMHLFQNSLCNECFDFSMWDELLSSDCSTPTQIQNSTAKIYYKISRTQLQIISLISRIPRYVIFINGIYLRLLFSRSVLLLSMSTVYRQCIFFLRKHEKGIVVY